MVLPLTLIPTLPLHQVPCRFTNLGVLRKQECERVQVTQRVLTMALLTWLHLV